MANLAQIHLQIRRSEGGLSRVTCLLYAWLVKKMSRDRQLLWKTGIILVWQIMYFIFLAKSVDKNYGVRSKSYIV